MDLSLLQELGRWETTVSVAETADPIWKLHAYRLARYLADRCLDDLRSAATAQSAHSEDQLRRAVISISANIAEGYSRRTPVDRTRFYSYALGSIREAMVWYTSLRSQIPAARFDERADQIAQLRRLVLGMHAKGTGPGRNEKGA